MGMKPRLDFSLDNVKGTVSTAKAVGEFGNIPGTVSNLKQMPINPTPKMPGTETPQTKK